MAQGNTTLDELTPRVVDWFRMHARQFGLNPASIEARYILNWGGYVNASFHITDGSNSYHLKLTDEDWSLALLEKWRDVHAFLSARYHAPRMLDWVEIPSTGFAGPVFEQIQGKPADLPAQPQILQGVMDLVARLHADEELVETLGKGEEPPQTYGDYFISVYIERFDEDLQSVAGDLPPFVSLDLLDWMMGETRKLEGMARELPAFHQPALSPTHGDLWASNILVTGDADFTIIDWDDLSLGDPALEYGILLGPFWRSGLRSMSELEQLLPAGEALRERFRVCLRAFLLDQVIDTLADWVESTFAPEHQEQVRAQKETRHRESLALYQELVPGLINRTAITAKEIRGRCGCNRQDFRYCRQGPRPGRFLSARFGRQRQSLFRRGGWAGRVRRLKSGPGTAPVRGSAESRTG